MKFFQKRWVAWTLCVLVIFGSTLLNTRWKLGARCSELAGSFYGEGSIAQSLSQLGEDGLSLAKLAEANGIDAGALHVAAAMLRCAASWTARSGSSLAPAWAQRTPPRSAPAWRASTPAMPGSTPAITTPRSAASCIAMTTALPGCLPIWPGWTCRRPSPEQPGSIPHKKLRREISSEFFVFISSRGRSGSGLCRWDRGSGKRCRSDSAAPSCTAPAPLAEWRVG